MEHQQQTDELKKAEEFCRECLKNRMEIEKLFECGFFEYEIGLVSIHKANKIIRQINKPKEFKWNK